MFILITLVSITSHLQAIALVEQAARKLVGEKIIITRPVLLK